jgi:hypothetical protein
MYCNNLRGSTIYRTLLVGWSGGSEAKRSEAKRSDQPLYSGQVLVAGVRQKNNTLPALQMVYALLQPRSTL